VLPGTFTVEGFCELVHTEKVTNAGVVPTILAMIVEYKDIDQYDFSSLTSLGVGGGALPLGLKLKAEEKIPGFTVSSGYGMTETAPAAIGAFVKKYMKDWTKDWMKSGLKPACPYPDSRSRWWTNRGNRCPTTTKRWVKSLSEDPGS
jgi:acyl-CoA synthetase (AMP-forming)/AMP-acid ligase II